MGTEKNIRDIINRKRCGSENRFTFVLVWSGCLSETKYLLLFLESSWQPAQNGLQKLFFLSTTGLRRLCVREWTLNERPARNVREHGLSSGKIDIEFCVDEFFNLLPRLPSHYCQSRSSKLHLEPLLQSFADVYELSITKCNKNNQCLLSRQVVKTIFDEYKLALFHARKDQCEVCVACDYGNIDEQVCSCIRIAKKLLRAPVLWTKKRRSPR